MFARLPILILGGLAALGIAAPDTFADPAATAAAGCAYKASDARLLFKTKTAVMFEREARSGKFKGTVVTFGCLFSKGINVPLSFTEVDGEIETVDFAGRYVAFDGSKCTGDAENCRVTVKVFDLASGKRVRSGSAYGKGQNNTTLADLTVTTKGFVAWIAENTDADDNDTPVEIRALDSSGARLLDRGAGISTKSMSVKNSKVSWRNNGATKSATLS
jgi:hypothetical protein